MARYRFFGFCFEYSKCLEGYLIAENLLPGAGNSPPRGESSCDQIVAFTMSGFFLLNSEWMVCHIVCVNFFPILKRKNMIVPDIGIQCVTWFRV